MNFKGLMEAVTKIFGDCSSDTCQNKVFVHDGHDDYVITEVYVQDKRLVINIQRPRKGR